MTLARRAFCGALGGLGGTLALTRFRKVMAGFGLVGTTAPEQVIERLEELRVLDDLSSEARRVLAALAHLAYGVVTGTALGRLLRERGAIVEEVSVGSALGIVAWGAGWFSWLPLAGGHLPQWEQQSPKVLLPVLDHTVFGAVRGILYSTTKPNRV
jgi:hypothetical protein